VAIAVAVLIATAPPQFPFSQQVCFAARAAAVNKPFTAKLAIGPHQD
jgi:hypothetical protein